MDGDSTSAFDLYIVGAGTLGLSLVREWLLLHPSALVVAETATPSRHVALSFAGAVPELRAHRRSARFPFVVYCVPPSAVQSAPYAVDVRAAMDDLWDPSGAFVFVSSGGVMAETAAPGTTVVTERHPIAHGERVAAAVEAEEEALRRGGCVVRLAGLYSEVRGPHRVYLSRRELPGNASRLVNLVHVDDAARSVVAALEKGLAARGRVFLVADGEPVSRKDIARLALELEEYRGREMPVFEEENGPLEGKVYDCSWTRQQLGWSPRFRSFRHFVEERARR